MIHFDYDQRWRTHRERQGGTREESAQGRLPGKTLTIKENVEESCREGTEPVLSLLDQQYNRYRLAEGQLLRSQQSIITKIPEIEKTIQMVESLSGNASTQHHNQKWRWTS